MKPDLTHLTPMERMFVTGAIKRHAAEPLLDKPHMDVGVIVAGLLAVGVTAIWVVLLIAGVRAGLNWLRWL